MKYFDEKAIINHESNTSFIRLVLKVKHPLSIGDYRSINLIGNIYKIISKFLVDLLKNVISMFISQEKSSYSTNRNILDGPLVINKEITWVRKRKKCSSSNLMLIRLLTTLFGSF